MTHGTGRFRRMAALLGLAVVVTACSPAATVSPTPAAPSGSPTAPGGSTSAVQPSPTGWPGNVPDAVIALGKLDEQMAIAGKAMDAAVKAEDVKALTAAARGLVDLVDGNADNVKTVQGYAGTKELGDGYAQALAAVRAGSQAIADGAAKGDATAVDAGIAGLGQGITLYGLARRMLGPYLEQAISMKKKYVK